MYKASDSKSRFYISFKGNYAVLVIAGELTKHGIELLQEAQRELLELEAKCFVFCFQDVISIDKRVYPQLIGLQHEVRKKATDLLICGLSIRLKLAFDKQGALRSDELVPSIGEAFKLFIKRKKLRKKNKGRS